MNHSYVTCRCGSGDAPPSKHDIECPRYLRLTLALDPEPIANAEGVRGPTGAAGAGGGSNAPLRCRDCGATAGSTDCGVTGFACVMEAGTPYAPLSGAHTTLLHEIEEACGVKEEGLGGAWAAANAELRPEAKLPYTQAGRAWTPTEMAERKLDDATHTSHAIDLGRQHIAHLRSIPPCGGDHAEDTADRLWADASAGERERRFKARLEGDLQLNGPEQAPEPQPERSLQWQVTALTEAVRALQQDFQKLLEIQSTLIEMVGKEK